MTIYKLNGGQFSHDCSRNSLDCKKRHIFKFAMFQVIKKIFRNLSWIEDTEH